MSQPPNKNVALIRQVKFFVSTNLNTLEDDVNKFLMTKPDRAIDFIKFDINNTTFIVTIIFIEKKKEGKKNKRK